MRSNVDQISFNSGGAVEDYNLEDIDFEADGFGANWVWTVHNNHSNPALEIVPNPNLSSSNSSENVHLLGIDKRDGKLTDMFGCVRMHLNAC